MRSSAVRLHSNHSTTRLAPDSGYSSHELVHYGEQILAPNLESDSALWWGRSLTCQIGPIKLIRQLPPMLRLSSRHIIGIKGLVPTSTLSLPHLKNPPYQLSTANPSEAP